MILLNESCSPQAQKFGFIVILRENFGFFTSFFSLFSNPPPPPPPPRPSTPNLGLNPNWGIHPCVTYLLCKHLNCPAQDGLFQTI